jgi:hypothetical protein
MRPLSYREAHGKYRSLGLIRTSALRDACLRLYLVQPPTEYITMYSLSFFSFESSS